MSRRLSAATLALLLAAAAAASSAPDWLLRARKTAVPPALLATDPPPDAVYLWRQHIITAGSLTGATRLYDREALEVLTPKGVEAGTFSTEYDDDSSVKIEGAWTLHAAGDAETLDLPQVVTVQVADAEYFTDQHVVAFRPPRLAPGDTAAYALWRKSHRDVYQWPILLQSRFPVAAEQVVVDLPEGWRHTWRLTRAPAGYQGPLSGEGGNKASYTFGPQPGLRAEESAPPFADRAASIEVAVVPPGEKFAGSVFRSWDDVARWFWSRSAPARTAAPATPLAAGSGPPAIARWVQTGIRYVAVEAGEGAYVPRTPALVAQRRYGDCKDKSFLLRALLAEAGVEADPVLTRPRTEGAIDRRFPSPVAFDHVILAVRESQASGLPAETIVSGKPVLLFDPTADSVPWGSLPAALQGGRGLIVTAGGGTLIDFPWAPPALNHYRRFIDAHMDGRGRLVAHVREERHGSMANRDSYRDLSPSERSDAVARRAGWQLPGSLVTGVAFSHLDDIGQPLEIRYDLGLDRFLRRAGSLVLLPVLPLSVAPGRLAGIGTRTSPIELGTPRVCETTETIGLPPGMRTDGLPDPIAIRNDYVRYSFSVKEAAGRLEVSERYEVLNPEIPVANLSAWRELENAAGTAASSQAVLVPAP